ncbi:MAG: TonB-dependent receptor plug domain-containing protein [Bacteroidota bacterium]
MNTINRFFLAISIVIMWSCAPNQPTSSESPNEPRPIQVNNAQTLADLFVRLPGVFVDERGGIPEVYIRGNRPLFVVDGVQVGFSYRDVDTAVNVQDVASVEVLRSVSETVIYGRQGSNGVIVIRTR